MDPVPQNPSCNWENACSNEVRLKLGALVLFNPLLIVARIACRIFTLLSGDFVKAGREFGTTEWSEERQMWSMSNDRTLPFPDESRLTVLVLKQSCIQLAKNIAKIITLPLALIALEFAAIYGAIFHPEGGKIIFGGTEHLWSRDLLELTGPQSNHNNLLRIADYIAPCMQDRKVNQERGLFRLWKIYNEGTLRSLLNSIILELSDNFYAREFACYKDKYSWIVSIQELMQEYYDKVKEVSSKDSDEIDPVTGNLNQLPRQAKIAVKLNHLKSIILSFKGERERIISLQSTVNAEKSEVKSISENFVKNLKTAIDSFNNAWETKKDFSKRTDFEDESYYLLRIMKRKLADMEGDKFESDFPDIYNTFKEKKSHYLREIDVIEKSIRNVVNSEEERHQFLRETKDLTLAFTSLYNTLQIKEVEEFAKTIDEKWQEFNKMWHNTLQPCRIDQSQECKESKVEQ